MAVGIRDLKSPNRMAYYQTIVQTFTSCPELLKMRNELAGLSFKAEELKKNEFFANGFRAAYRLLFELFLFNKPIRK